MTLLKKTLFFLFLFFYTNPTGYVSAFVQTTEYHALLVTNLEYDDNGWRSLTSNRQKQIKQLHKTLREYNYTVTRIVNSDHNNLLRELDSFFEKHQNTNNKLLIYYVGYCNSNTSYKQCFLPVETPFLFKNENIPVKNSIPITDLFQQARNYGIKQLILAVDGSISTHTSNFTYLQPVSKDYELVAKNDFKYAIIAAGEEMESEPISSNFTRLFNMAMKKGSRDQTLASFFTILRENGSNNSLRTPWCKTNLKGSNGLDFPLSVKTNALLGDGWSQLRISTIPEDAKVRILNIKPRFNPVGNRLMAGNYTIEVSAKGYVQTIKKVTLYQDEDVNFQISLKTRSAAFELSPIISDKKSPTLTSENTIPLQTNKENEMDLINIPAGSFIMGGERYPELPKHVVSIKSIQVMVSEVSQREYNIYLKSTKQTSLSTMNTSAPITGVNWDEAINYAKWLSNKTTNEYRLPTEAEWEYIARLNNPNQLLSANVLPGKIGVRDMPGGIMEWCSDCYKDNYSSPPETTINIKCSNRVVRDTRYQKSINGVTMRQLSSRMGILPTTKMNNIGFRLVRVVTQKR